MAAPQQARFRFLVPDPAMPVEPVPVHPRFSVIVAAYQAAGTIGAAVESALTQRPPPHEVIVCDDGSDDDIEGALRRFGTAVRLIRISHGGEGAARNAAAAAATGDWLVLLDADDEWLPGRLAAMGELARRRPDLDMIDTDAWMELDGQRIGRLNGPQNPFPVTDQKREILRRNFFFSHLAVRKSRWDEVGGYDVSAPPAADWDCWLRLLWSGSIAGSVDAPLAAYRVYPESQSGNRPHALRARVKVLDKAARTQPLDPESRRILFAARREWNRRSLLAELEQAVLAGDPGTSRVAARTALAPAMPLASRVKAVGAMLAPALAARWLRRQEGRRRSHLQRL